MYIYLHKITKLFETGSAKLALEVLVDSGCKPINIMFLNLICAPEGLEALRNNYPEVRIRNKYYNYEKFCFKFILDNGYRNNYHVYFRYML